ncbi:hypothetical protein GCM10022235_86420 [Kribbella ginsengisoli]|uniref:Uncharacterized protein n=1 Tax=Kribbella ginsengisoli TaxID=363865 RepID=A0ABP6ZA94_9ACTN
MTIRRTVTCPAVSVPGSGVIASTFTIPPRISGIRIPSVGRVVRLIMPRNSGSVAGASLMLVSLGVSGLRDLAG